MTAIASARLAPASLPDARLRPERAHRRAANRSGAILGGLAVFIALWLGLTAPAVSPIVPAPVTVSTPPPGGPASPPRAGAPLTPVPDPPPQPGPRARMVSPATRAGASQWRPADVL